MTDLDEIETRVQAVLTAAPFDFKTEGWFDSRTARTRIIKDRLRQLASEFRFRSDQGEWLYDLTWYEMTRGEAGDLVRVPLVLECEWSPDPDIDGDFQKLVQARAEHRIWVFRVESGEAINRYFGACEKQVAAFRGTLAGDRYLLAGVDRGLKEFHFHHYVAERSGAA